MEEEIPEMIPMVGFTKGVLYYMLSDYIENFGTSLREPILGPFNFNKLHLSRKDLTHIITLFGGLQHLLTPAGGILSDLIYNKVYAVVGIFASLFVGHALFASLTFPAIRADNKWPIIYSSEVIKTLSLALLEPVLLAFVMDQFVYPRVHQTMLMRYVHLNNIVDHVTSILGFWISPWMKSRIPCLGEQDCFLIPYAMFLILFLASKAVLVYGRGHYVKKKPDWGTVTDVFPCIWYGFYYWCKERKTDPQEHWMDHALVVYDEDVVEEAKALLRILFLDIRVPFFKSIEHHYAFLTTCIKMKFNWRLGKKKLIPDHINLLVPVVGLITWLLMGKVIEPYISETKTARPLRRMIYGYCIDIATTLYYVVLAAVMMTNFPVLPGRREAQLRIINGAECDCVVQMSKFINESVEVASFGVYRNLHVPVEGHQAYEVTVHGACFETSTGASYLDERQGVTVYIRPRVRKHSVRIVSYTETISRPMEKALPYISVLGADIGDKIALVDHRGVVVDMPPASEEQDEGSTLLTHAPRTFEALPDKYKLYRNGRYVTQFDTNLGGVYHVTLMGWRARLIVMVDHNFVHFGWWLPALLGRDLGRYMIAVGEADFYYPETPPSLRGITFALRCFILAIGTFMTELFYFDVSIAADLYCYAVMKMVILTTYIVCATRVISRFDDRILL